MFRVASVLLPFLAIALVVDGASPAKQETFVCGKKLSEVEGYIKAWLAASSNLPFKKLDPKADHITQYNMMRDLCKNVKDKKGIASSKDAIEQVQKAIDEFQEMFPPIQADLDQMDKMFHVMENPLKTELQELQTAVYRSTIASGRTEWALFYSILEEKTDPKLDGLYEASNIPELLRYAWSLSDVKQLQRNVYGMIGAMVDSAQDPLLKTIYAVDLAHTENDLLEERNQVIGQQLQGLQSNLTANSYDTLLKIALRYPEHYAYVVKHLFSLPEGSRLDPATLPIASNFIGQLSREDQRLQTTEALLKSLMTENGTLISEAEYVYPLSKMAHRLAKDIVNVKHAGLEEQQESLDILKGKFGTSVVGKSMEYFLNVRSSGASDAA